MSTYSIKDLENLSGIKAHTLRIWEQRYGILQPERTDTNIRTYTDRELKLVLNIALLQEKGRFKISEIAKMTEEELAKHILNLSEGHFDFPEQVQALTLAMLDLDENRFQLLTQNIVKAYGFENYMIHIVYPFMHRLGTLWLSGSVGPAQEHFISHLIRQKLIAFTDQQSVRLKPNHKKFLLYLPEGELHEIGLLFANYILRARGQSVVYLGQSLPYEELIIAKDIHHPDYIVSVFTSMPGPAELEEYFKRLEKDLGQTPMLLSGYQVFQYQGKLPKQVMKLSDFNHLIELAER